MPLHPVTLQLEYMLMSGRALLFFPSFLFRFAARPEQEWSCWVVVIQDAQCMLCVPNLDPQSGQAATDLSSDACQLQL